MFKIISDGGCDFTNEEAKKLDVTVVPFYISFDQNSHLKEGIDISNEDYFNRLATEKNLFPKTAQPNPQDYIDYYTPALEAGLDIIAITISSKVSGSNNSANIAADILRNDFPARTIEVIDSLNGSVGQGLILREMIKMRDAGFSLKRTVKLAKEVLKTTRIYFTVESLEYLKKGGRIGPTTALVGGILGLRPILQLVDGEVSQLDSVRGKKNSLRLINEAMVYAVQDAKADVRIGIGHIRSESDAASFKSKMEADLGIEIDTPITCVGAAIGTHTGPGALAFAYCKKYEAIIEEIERVATVA